MADYIERDAVLAVIGEKQKLLCPLGLWGRRHTYDREAYDKWQEFPDEIDKIPTADATPVRHGQWITWEDAGNFIPSPDRYECSVCHDAAHRLCNGNDLLSPYCPNCGAKMNMKD